jgi:hypothetical protein
MLLHLFALLTAATLTDASLAGLRTWVSRVRVPIWVLWAKALQGTKAVISNNILRNMADSKVFQREAFPGYAAGKGPL